MNAAEKLRQELTSNGSFDKAKVIETVYNGIRNNGGLSEIIIPYNPPSKVVYGSYDIECPNSETCEGIRQFLLQQGFRVRTAYHPVSHRPYGYEARL